MQDSDKLLNLAGEHPAIRQAAQLVEELADTDAPVLIRGETGTGKTLVARLLHLRSRRGAEPFVTHACAPTARGDDAVNTATSIASAIATTQHGTLLLRDLEYASPEAQQHLVEQITKTDARLLAATTADLAALVARGDFRQDLYYRLSLIEVVLPPLRERGDDVLLLARRFLQRFGGEAGIAGMRLSPAAERALRDHPFPGNVGELQRMMRRAVLLCDDNTVEPVHLDPPPVAMLPPADALRQTFAQAKQEVVDAFERYFVRMHLQATAGNVTQAAKRSGMYKANFIQKMKKHGIDRLEFVQANTRKAKSDEH